MRNRLTLFLCSIFLLGSPGVKAQLKGTHLLGDAGLKSGTQGPPGFNIVVPVYAYDARKLRNDAGDVATDNVDLAMFVTGLGFSWVLPQKILGGHLGGTVLFPFASNRLSSNLTNTSSAFAFTDIFFQPVQMGWAVKQADFTAGYTLYLPSGKYEKGGDDNSGLGMLVNEFSAGSTVYFNQKKTWHISSLLSYALNSKKKDTDIKTGDVLSIEGGLGKTWYAKPLKGDIPVIINAGLIYYMQFKTTADVVPVDTVIVSLGGNKDKTIALGPEANIYLPGLRSLVSLRWVSEVMAHNRFQGNTFLLTIAFSAKSFAKK
jgi:hypothetical protein